MKFNKGDRVTMSPMWKYEVAVGTVIRTSSEGSYFVKWDDINVEWYYTPEQATRLKLLKENNKEG
tara:strand:- start:87 stop:281 length:195 start_codon:yes stop_codon:yes gene_type:complete